MKKDNAGPEETLYRLGLVAALVAATGFFLWQVLPTGVKEWMQRWSFCVIYRFTGYLCPGCGGTRAFRELLHGHLIASLLYHPLVIYGVVLYVVYMASHTCEKLGRLVRRADRRTVREGEQDRKRAPRMASVVDSHVTGIRGLRWRTGYITAAVWLLAGNFILKNLIHLITGMDVLAELERLLAG